MALRPRQVSLVIRRGAAGGDPDGPVQAVWRGGGPEGPSLARSGRRSHARLGGPGHGLAFPVGAGCGARADGAYLLLWASIGRGRWCRGCKRFDGV